MVTAWLFGPPRGVPSSPWGPVGAVLAVVFAVVLAGVLLVGVVAVTPGLRRAFDTRCTETTGSQCIMALLAAMNLVYFFVAAGLAVACWFRRGASLGNSLLLRSAHWRLWQYLVFALLTVVSVIVLQQIIFYVYAQFGLGTGDPSSDLERLRQFFGFDEPATIILMVLLAVVLAPLAEEFVFRGMLFAAFQKTRLGPVGSGLLLSALWSVMHWGYSSQNLVALFILGLLFAYVVWRTGSLWPALVGHGANNLVAVLALVNFQGQGG